MLKLVIESSANSNAKQPPSGGCVLKLAESVSKGMENDAAAFGRLCVETLSSCWRRNHDRAAAFGRLCVETSVTRKAA